MDHPASPLTRIRPVFWRLCQAFASVRRPLEIFLFVFVLLLLVQEFIAETFIVPTGSMAPALLGHHRQVACPGCGLLVRVGRYDPKDEALNRRRYETAACSNCGCDQLGLAGVRDTRGDRLLVNKLIYELRRPRRWELAVFRLFAIIFVKRIIGLPGELLEIRDGDIYVDGALARKTLAELKAMRILVFDNDHQPQPDGWRNRWELLPSYRGAHPLVGTELHLQPGEGEDFAEVCYSHQSHAVFDEYGYNGKASRQASVHDFMLECQLEVTSGNGWVRLALTDGQDRVVAELPVSQPNGANEQKPARLYVHGQPQEQAVTAPVSLQPGKRYNLEMAFVDRRATLAIDGAMVFTVDLPTATRRAGVSRPATLGVQGVSAVVRHVRLYRDVHYTQDGANAVGGTGVRLGPDQYFVLGDNSPRSEDSRHWPDHGAVPGRNLIGRPMRMPWLR